MLLIRLSVQACADACLCVEELHPQDTTFLQRTRKSPTSAGGRRCLNAVCGVLFHPAWTSQHWRSSAEHDWWWNPQDWKNLATCAAEHQARDPERSGLSFFELCCHAVRGDHTSREISWNKRRRSLRSPPLCWTSHSQHNGFPRVERLRRLWFGLQPSKYFAALSSNSPLVTQHVPQGNPLKFLQCQLVFFFEAQMNAETQTERSNKGLSECLDSLNTFGSLGTLSWKTKHRSEFVVFLVCVGVAWTKRDTAPNTSRTCPCDKPMTISLLAQRRHPSSRDLLQANSSTV